jgi:hypothetical protein
MPDPRDTVSQLARGPDKPMQIVFAFEDGVNGYADAFGKRRLVEMDKCPVCQTAGCLVRHGLYWRKPRDGERVYHLPIQRWWCKACHHTISALPDFLLRFRWYLLSVMNGVLVARAEDDVSWGALQAEAAGAPHVRTMRRWWTVFGRQAAGWLAVIQAFLAQQDSPSPWLDPQGEAARSPSAAQALLSAAGHLLAWAKSRWAELAGYGWNDRLRFVWLWGSGRGMERLV